ncbi:MAG TPA: T9SS type A sorting domain-containing protein, partial [Bacteroidales bacterium]|nr:T9SS type A sorting domain-containing protein [Bacteroidales bacterium]
SGKMLVWFTSNATNKFAGFAANYTSTAKNFAGLVDENTEDDIVKIMPNPSNGKFSLVFPEMSEASAFYITDVMGKIVYSSDLQPSANMQKIDLALDLANGMYYLTINTPQARISRMIVISKEN